MATQDELDKKLFDAVDANDLDAVKQALADGADIYIKNNDGDRALAIAGKSGNIAITKALMEAEENKIVLLNRDTRLQGINDLLTASNLTKDDIKQLQEDFNNVLTGLRNQQISVDGVAGTEVAYATAQYVITYGQGDILASMNSDLKKNLVEKGWDIDALAREVPATPQTPKVAAPAAQSIEIKHIDRVFDTLALEGTWSEQRTKELQSVLGLPETGTIDDNTVTAIAFAVTEFDGGAEVIANLNPTILGSIVKTYPIDKLTQLAQNNERDRAAAATATAPAATAAPAAAAPSQEVPISLRMSQDEINTKAYALLTQDEALTEAQTIELQELIRMPVEQRSGVMDLNTVDEISDFIRFQGRIGLIDDLSANIRNELTVNGHDLDKLRLNMNTTVISREKFEATPDGADPKPLTETEREVIVQLTDFRMFNNRQTIEQHYSGSPAGIPSTLRAAQQKFYNTYLTVARDPSLDDISKGKEALAWQRKDKLISYHPAFADMSDAALLDEMHRREDAFGLSVTNPEINDMGLYVPYDRTPDHIPGGAGWYFGYSKMLAVKTLTPAASFVANSNFGSFVVDKASIVAEKAGDFSRNYLFYTAPVDTKGMKAAQKEANVVLKETKAPLTQSIKSVNEAYRSMDAMSDIGKQMGDVNGALDNAYKSRAQDTQKAITKALGDLDAAAKVEEKASRATQKALDEANSAVRTLARSGEYTSAKVALEKSSAELRTLEQSIETQKSARKSLKLSERAGINANIRDMQVQIDQIKVDQAADKTVVTRTEKKLNKLQAAADKAKLAHDEVVGKLDQIAEQKTYFDKAGSQVDEAIRTGKPVKFAPSQQRLAAIQHAVISTQARFEAAQTNLQAERGTAHPAKPALDDTSKEAKAARAERKAKADRLVAHRQERAQALKDVKAIQKEFADIQQAAAEAQKPEENRRLKAEAEAQVRNAEVEHARVSQELADAKDVESTAKKANEKAFGQFKKEQRALFRKAYTEQKAVVDSLESNLRNTQSNITGAQTKLGNANNDLQNFNTQFEDYKAQVKNHQGSSVKDVKPKAGVKEGLEKRVESARNSLNTLESKANALETQLGEERAKFEKMDAPVQERITAAKTETQQALDDLEQARRNHKLAKEKARQTSANVQAANENLNKVNVDINASQAPVSSSPTPGATGATHTAPHGRTTPGSKVLNVTTNAKKYSGMIARSTWNAGATGLAKLGKVAKFSGKVIGKAIPPAAIIIGTGMSMAEADELNENAALLAEAGLIPQESLEDLQFAYGIYQVSGGDPSVVGVEAEVEREVHNTFAAHDVDRAMQSILRPQGLLRMGEEIFLGADYTERELLAMKERYTDENVVKLYDQIAEQYGLPLTIDLTDQKTGESFGNVSIGQAIRDPEFKARILESMAAQEKDMDLVNRGIAALELVGQASAVAQQALFDHDADYRKEMQMHVDYLLYNAAQRSTLGTSGTLDIDELEYARDVVMQDWRDAKNNYELSTKATPEEKAQQWEELLKQTKRLQTFYAAVDALPENHPDKLEMDADDKLEFFKKYKQADIKAIAGVFKLEAEKAAAEAEAKAKEMAEAKARAEAEEKERQRQLAEQKAQEEEMRKKMEEEQRQREAAKAEASSKKKPDATVVSSDSTTNDPTASAEADSAPCDNKVLETQALLRLIGQYNGPIDGIITPETAKAIKAYAATQKDLPDNSSIDRVHNELKYRLYTDPDFQKTVVLGVLGAFEKKPMDREDIKAAQVAMNIGGAKGLDGKALDITGKPCKDTINALSEYTEATQPIIENAPAPVVQNDAPAAQNDNVVSGDTCKQKFNGVAEHYGAVIWEKAQSTKEPIHFHVPQYMKDKVQVNGSGATTVNTVEITDGIAVMDWREKDEHWQLEIGRAENAGRNGVLDMYPDGRLSITVLADDADDVQGLTKKWVRRDFTEYLSENPAFVNMLDEVPFFDKTEAHDHMALAYDAAKEALGDKFDPKAGIALYISLNGDGQYKVRVFEDCGKMQIRMIADDKNCDPAVTKAVAQTPKELQKVHKPSDFTAENLKKTFPNYKTPEERVEEARVAAEQAEQEALASRSCYARDELSPLQKAACQKNEEIPGHSSNVGYPGAGKKI